MEGKDHAFDEEPNVDSPCTDCQCHSNIIFVPNGNTGGPSISAWYGEMIVERKLKWTLTCEEQSIAKQRPKTGMKKSDIKLVLGILIRGWARKLTSRREIHALRPQLVKPGVYANATYHPPDS